jgi:cytidylate kinase
MSALHPMSAEGYWRGARAPQVEHVPLQVDRQARFITISRQAGAGATTLAGLLVGRLSQMNPAQPWKAYDHELVDMTAHDFHLSGRMVEEVVDSAGGSWLEELFQGMSGKQEEYPSEVKVYHRVARTIRALAARGRAVLIGRGGVYITRDVPDGVHVRLVAPLHWRIERMAEMLKVSKEDAAAKVEEIDRRRRTFYQKYWYWQGDLFSPELFTVTINMAAMDEAQAVECVMALAEGRTGGR